MFKGQKALAISDTERENQVKPMLLCEPFHRSHPLRSPDTFIQLFLCRAKLHKGNLISGKICLHYRTKLTSSRLQDSPRVWPRPAAQKCLQFCLTTARNLEYEALLDEIITEVERSDLTRPIWHPAASPCLRSNQSQAGLSGYGHITQRALGRSPFI